MYKIKGAFIAFATLTVLQSLGAVFNPRYLIPPAIAGASALACILSNGAEFSKAESADIADLNVFTHGIIGGACSLFLTWYSWQHSPQPFPLQPHTFRSLLSLGFYYAAVPAVINAAVFLNGKSIEAILAPGESLDESRRFAPYSALFYGSMAAGARFLYGRQAISPWIYAIPPIYLIPACFAPR